MLILFITNFFSHQGITNLSLLGCFSLKLSDCHLPKRNCFICFNEGPFKMINNSVNFMVKALFILKIFKFLSFPRYRAPNSSHKGISNQKWNGFLELLLGIITHLFFTFNLEDLIKMLSLKENT